MALKTRCKAGTADTSDTLCWVRRSPTNGVSRTANGRLVELWQCEETGKRRTTVVAFDKENGYATLGQYDIGADAVSYAENLGLTILGSNDFRCGGISSGTQTAGIEPLIVELPSGGAVQLGRPLSSSGKSCPEFIVAGFPFLAKGDSILFTLVAKDAVGRPMTDRSALDRSLMAVDIATGVAREVTRNLKTPWALAVDSGGRRSYVAANRDGVDGVWKIDNETGAVELVKTGWYSSVGLSPDGRSLARHPANRQRTSS